MTDENMNQEVVESPAPEAAEASEAAEAAEAVEAAEVSEASFLAPFIYTKIVWTAVLGYLLFEHVPGPALWLGSSLIIGGGLYVYLKERAA